MKTIAVLLVISFISCFAMATEVESATSEDIQEVDHDIGNNARPEVENSKEKAEEAKERPDAVEERHDGNDVRGELPDNDHNEAPETESGSAEK